MNKTRVFQFLENQDASVLLDLLRAAYDEMKTTQRQVVFGKFARELPPSPIDGKKLLKEIQQFHRESLGGAYYAPFDINSKNFMHVPEETEEWFERLGDLLDASAKLTEQGAHSQAVKCFGLLYELIFAMEEGQEIVFADEIGSWMIPGDEKKFIAAYISSLAATATPEEFTAATLPLIRRDSYQSFATQAYSSAIRMANKAQKAHLKAEIQHQKIRTNAKS